MEAEGYNAEDSGPLDTFRQFLSAESDSEAYLPTSPQASLHSEDAQLPGLNHLEENRQGFYNNDDDVQLSPVPSQDAHDDDGRPDAVLSAYYEGLNEGLALAEVSDEDEDSETDSVNSLDFEQSLISIEMRLHTARLLRVRSRNIAHPVDRRSRLRQIRRRTGVLKRIARRLFTA